MLTLFSGRMYLHSILNARVLPHRIGVFIWFVGVSSQSNTFSLSRGGRIRGCVSNSASDARHKPGYHIGGPAFSRDFSFYLELRNP